MTYKLIIPAIALIMAMGSCTSKRGLVGNDKDSHGCIGSAGYTWSIVKNDCIRVFEDGIALRETKANSTSTQAAYIVASPDSTRMELFMPGGEESIVMFREGKDAESWSQNSKFMGAYKLVRNESGKWTVSEGNKPLYESYEK